MAIRTKVQKQHVVLNFAQGITLVGRPPRIVAVYFRCVAIVDDTHAKLIGQQPCADDVLGSQHRAQQHESQWHDSQRSLPMMVPPAGDHSRGFVPKAGTNGQAMPIQNRMNGIGPSHNHQMARRPWLYTKMSGIGLAVWGQHMKASAVITKASGGMTISNT